MDSNGRHRAPSGSNLTLPSSSTFRRLPTLARSPFKRSDKTSSQPSDTSVQATDHALEPETTIMSNPLEQNAQNLTRGTASFQLLPPSRTSSLPQTPNISDVNDNHPIFDKQHSNSSTSSFQQHQGASSSIMPTLQSSTSVDPNDLEPITYPAHLAQAKPPASPNHAQQANPRSRDTSIAAGSSIVLGAVAGAYEGVGPPNGVPKRKDSIINPRQEIPAQGLSSAQALHPDDKPRRGKESPPVPSAAARERDTETDSGADDAGIRRHVAGTKSTVDRNPLGATSRRPDRDSPSDRERNRKTSSKTLRGAKEASHIKPSLPSSRGVVRAPASAMYFSLIPCHGRPPSQALRAHSGTLVGDRIWLIGGVDKHSCWRGVSWFDTESLQWTTIETQGEQFPPLRAHSTTLVGEKLYIFGGGDGPSYSNEVWTLNIETHHFAKPIIGSPRSALPPPRRAHTTVYYRNYLVVFGGGNGQAALNDVWALDVSDPENLSWHEWKTKGDIPQKKGYHTANLVGDKMIVFGGSDGHASFADVHILNLKTLVWTLVVTDVKHNRLSHTSTQVGSYLFVIGGHNGQTYAQDVLLFNLVTLQWETKTPRGTAPPGRGYHVALLHDARIFISGGYNGESVFDDLWSLDLSAGAYLPQVTTFEVDETAGLGQHQVRGITNTA